MVNQNYEGMERQSERVGWAGLGEQKVSREWFLHIGDRDHHVGNRCLSILTIVLNKLAIFQHEYKSIRPNV
jgi:hypothetical protein